MVILLFCWYKKRLFWAFKFLVSALQKNYRTSMSGLCLGKKKAFWTWTTWVKVWNGGKLVIIQGIDKKTANWRWWKSNHFWNFPEDLTWILSLHFLRVANVKLVVYFYKRWNLIHIFRRVVIFAFNWMKDAFIRIICEPDFLQLVPDVLSLFRSG